MARIPILKDPGQLNTGNQTQQTPNLPAVTNASLGKALGNIGEMAMDISEKAKRADDVTKLTEASMAMNKAQQEFATFQQSPEGQDEKQWLPKWQEMQTKLQQDFNATKLTPEARLQLNDRFSDWGMRGTIGVQAQAYKQTGQRMDDIGQMAKQRAIETGDMSIYSNHLKDEVAGGFKRKEQADLLLLDADISYASRASENQWKSAVMEGDEKGLEAAIQFGKDRAGWDDDFVKAKRIAGMEGIERTKAVKKSKAESEFLGEIVYRKAQGEIITPLQIEGWVKENKIDKDTGARLLITTKSEQGAMQGEFFDFLNDNVDLYDPDKDPDGRKKLEINQKAANLGLNNLQLQYFQSRLERAEKLNGPQRAQQAILSAGEKAIGDALKTVGITRAWDSDAETLFKDPAKLQAFGISPDKAKEIEELTKGEFTWRGQPTGEGMDKAKALQLFKQQSATRVAVKPAGLSEGEWKKLTSLAESDTSTDPNAAMSAEFDRAALVEQFNSWYEYKRVKDGTPPGKKEVEAWVGDNTRALMQGTTAANFFQPKKPTTSNGVDVGTMELIKGFEGFTPKAYGDFKQTSVGYGTRARSADEELTQPEAEQRLQEELSMHSKRVDSLVDKYKATITPEQRSALVSFDFNTGSVHRLFDRAGADTSKWPSIIREFKNAGGSESAGLVNRRNKEASYFE
jgi:GH24 family phage-related lysozyme (muramidase)